MKIKRFEELKCWQEARKLTQAIYNQVKSTPFNKDLKLRDQLCGAAISIMNNICEGFDSQSNREFIRFLIYSRRSCSEVQSCLYMPWTKTISPKTNLTTPATNAQQFEK